MMNLAQLETRVWPTREAAMKALKVVARTAPTGTSFPVVKSKAGWIVEVRRPEDEKPPVQIEPAATEAERETITAENEPEAPISVEFHETDTAPDEQDVHTTDGTGMSASDVPDPELVDEPAAEVEAVIPADEPVPAETNKGLTADKLVDMMNAADKVPDTTPAPDTTSEKRTKSKNARNAARGRDKAVEAPKAQETVAAPAVVPEQKADVLVETGTALVVVPQPQTEAVQAPVMVQELSPLDMAKGPYVYCIEAANVRQNSVIFDALDLSRRIGLPVSVRYAGGVEPVRTIDAKAHAASLKAARGAAKADATPKLDANGKPVAATPRTGGPSAYPPGFIDACMSLPQRPQGVTEKELTALLGRELKWAGHLKHHGAKQSPMLKLTVTKDANGSTFFLKA